MSRETTMDHDDVSEADRHPASPSPDQLTALPSELTTKIFMFVVEDNPDDRWKTLLTLTGICSHLREVALNAQILWQKIKLGGIYSSGREVVRQMLTRSGTVPLFLQISLDPTIDFEYLSVVMHELHRVETLRIECAPLSDPNIMSTTVWNMPLLRHLYFRTHQPMAPLLILPNSPLSFLETVKTKGVPFHSLSRLFRPSMTRLDLLNCDPRTTTIEFLHALSRMPLLEELQCKNSLLPFHPSRSSDPGPQTVSLPHLRKLYLRDDTSACADILRHLVFPAVAFVSNSWEDVEENVIGIEASADSIEDKKEAFMSLLAAITLKLSGDGLLGPVPAPEKLVIELVAGYVDIEFHGCEPEHRPFFRHRAPDIDMRAGDVLECVCLAAHQSFLTGLRELSVRVFTNYDHSRGGNDKTWSREMLRLVGLEGLHLYRTPGIWDGLAGLHTDLWHPGDNPRAEVPQSLKDNLSAVTLPFPKLRTLTLDTCVFRSNPPYQIRYEDDPDDFIWSLLTMVKLRMLGDIPMELLDLRNMYHCKRSDLNLLGLYVDRVTWFGGDFTEDQYFDDSDEY